MRRERTALVLLAVLLTPVAAGALTVAPSPSLVVAAAAPVVVALASASEGDTILGTNLTSASTAVDLGGKVKSYSVIRVVSTDLGTNAVRLRLASATNVESLKSLSIALGSEPQIALAASAVVSGEGSSLNLNPGRRLTVEVTGASAGPGVAVLAIDVLLRPAGTTGVEVAYRWILTLE